MKLYWSWFINPQKVRLALNELGLAHEIVALRLLQGEQRKPEFLALNPNGKAPVLQDGNMTLWESNAILVYLGEKGSAAVADQHDQPRRCDALVVF